MTISSNHRGFTLIELMITLLLSLTITFGISQVLISSNKSALTADGMSQSQETGRFAISFLAKSIRQAGTPTVNDNNKPDIEDSVIIATPAFISCTQYASLNSDECIFEGAGGKTQDNITIMTAPPHGDRLAVSFVTNADTLRDCTGSTGYIIGAAANSTPYKVNERIINTFWVEFDVLSGMNSLYCQGHFFDGTEVKGSSAKQAIASGVEAIHFLYGEANTALAGAKNRNVSKFVAADDVTNWDRVYSVRVSMMTRSITDATDNNTLRSYVLLDAEPYAMTDAVNRQVFTTTYTVNNYSK
jgi:type IV pilus assembly protein PilW